MHGSGITLVGVHTLSRPDRESFAVWWTTRDDVLAIQKLVTAGRLEFASMIGEIHSPMEVPELYDRLVQGKDFPLFQFDWRMSLLCTD